MKIGLLVDQRVSKSYAGIGSRKTPDDICKLLESFATYLANNNMTLRTGGAEGADMSFMNGAYKANGSIEIGLPWHSFCGEWLNMYKSDNITIKIINDHDIDKCTEYIKKYHPAYDKLSQGAMKLMARNNWQILGFDLNDPVDFVVCWTSGAKISGGTGYALRMAQDFDIPIYNLGDKDVVNMVVEILAQQSNSD